MPVKIFFFFLVLMPVTAAAQAIETKEESARIDSEDAAGYEVQILAAADEVRSSLARYLKAMGKTKVSGDYITISEPLIGGTKYSGTLYATVKHVSGSAAAWIGMPMKSGEESNSGVDLQKIAYDFGVTFHREKIQLQIDESLRALQAVEKQQLRLANQNKDLNDKIEDNKREKIQLERSLVENKLELEQLTQQLTANATARDSIAIATEQIRKVVEMHRERQRKVN